MPSGNRATKKSRAIEIVREKEKKAKDTLLFLLLLSHTHSLLFFLPHQPGKEEGRDRKGGKERKKEKVSAEAQKKVGE